MAASSLDIVLPCFNPQEGWENRIIQNFKELCDQLPDAQLRIILVDDGSRPEIKEESFKKISDAIFFFRHHTLDKNYGKGYAVRKGVSLSDAEIVIYTDIDFPFTTAGFLSVWNILSSGQADIAAGILDDNYYDQVPTGRKILSRVLRFMTRFLLRTKISDTQRGLKGFNEKGKQVFLQTRINRYLFDLEFIFLASKPASRVRLAGVPVTLNDKVRFTKMKFGTILSEMANFTAILLMNRR